MRNNSAPHASRKKSASQLRREESDRVAQSRGAKLDARTYFANVQFVKNEYIAREEAQAKAAARLRHPSNTSTSTSTNTNTSPQPEGAAQ